MISFLGWLATILFTLCYFPQIIKIIKTKKVKDLSFLFFFIQVLANIVALCYAIMIKQGPLEFKYIAALVLDLIIVFFYIKYKEE